MDVGVKCRCLNICILFRGEIGVEAGKVQGKQGGEGEEDHVKIAKAMHGLQVRPQDRSTKYTFQKNNAPCS